MLSYHFFQLNLFFSYYTHLIFVFKERELKGKRAIERIGAKRELLRKERTKREIPVVAVVGYTNAGLFILELPLYIDVYKPEGSKHHFGNFAGYFFVLFFWLISM